ncbi:MAG: hypothetical protein QOG76_6619 [Pseudonocardiales bacterium]|nr:hypothetical protein [Pseudonocardiales bacterium]
MWEPRRRGGLSVITTTASTTAGSSASLKFTTRPGRLEGTNIMRPATKPPLREEVLRRRETDQRARRAFAALRAAAKDGKFRDSLDPRGRGIVFWMGEVDQDNTRWLKGVVAWYGWPTRSMVGDDGAAAAWLLVQHADHDRAFQRRCLVLMQALPADQTSPEHIAYLADRVRSAEN